MDEIAMLGLSADKTTNTISIALLLGTLLDMLSVPLTQVPLLQV